VLPCEHVGRGLSVEKPRLPEPPDESLPDSLGERHDVAWGDGSRRQERDGWVGYVIRRVTVKHAVGDAQMQMDMPIECRAETVQEGDGTDAGRVASGPVRCRCHACRLAHEPFHLAHEDLREGGHGLGPVALCQKPPQSPRVSAVASVSKSPTAARGPVE